MKHTRNQPYIQEENPKTHFENCLYTEKQGFYQLLKNANFETNYGNKNPKLESQWNKNDETLQKDLKICALFFLINQ